MLAESEIIWPDEIVYSKRKVLSLQINANGRFIVKAPNRAKKEWIEDFVRQKQEWIKKSLTKINHKNESSKISLQEGSEIPFLGSKYKLCWSNKAKKINLDQVFVLPESKREQMRAMIVKFYQTEARVVFQDRLDYWSAMMNLQYKSLKLSSAKSRWGSCSFDNNINLNWHLVLLDLELIDYVVVHELAHIRHKNHSSSFWELVEKYQPEWRKSRKLLKSKSPSICFVEIIEENKSV